MKKKSVIYVVFALVLVAGLTGCGAVSKLISSDPIKEMLLATPAGTLERMEATEVVQSTEAPLSSQLLYSDDFSDPDSGWSIIDDEYGTTNYVDGTYQIIAIKEGSYNWGVAGQYFSNIRIEVDVDILDNNPEVEDGFGVDCRIQDNGDGYGFRIDTSGNIAIELFYNDETTELVEWVYDDAVYTDGRTNHLTAVCNGSELTLIVNDIEVASTTDST
ncbi:MAG: LamG domain-containing protein [Anaerolineae bacterium]|nr:LamG domain-containing protein [Anaerolineae bacterium]